MIGRDARSVCAALAQPALPAAGIRGLATRCLLTGVRSRTSTSSDNVKTVTHQHVARVTGIGKPRNRLREEPVRPRMSRDERVYGEYPERASSPRPAVAPVSAGPARRSSHTVAPEPEQAETADQPRQVHRFHGSS